MKCPAAGLMPDTRIALVTGATAGLSATGGLRCAEGLFVQARGRDAGVEYLYFLARTILAGSGSSGDSSNDRRDPV
jgi:hypothetical protein